MTHLRLILLLALLAVGMPVLAQESGVMVIGGDEAALRRYIARVNAGFTIGVNSETDVYIGSLPPDLPFEPPLPEGAQVVGTLQQMGGDGFSEIVLDVPLPPRQVQGWWVCSQCTSGKLSAVFQ